MRGYLMRDSLYDNMTARPALAIATRTANAVVNGLTIDMHYMNNRFRSLMFIIHAGTVTDGTTTFTMQDSNDGSAWSAVASEYVNGSLPVVGSSNDDTLYDVEYTGSKRYVRLVATQATATAGATIGATAVMSNPRKTPLNR